MIYQLDHNIEHITESGVYDARLVRFPGEQNVVFGNPDMDYTAKVPSPIEFVGDLSQVKQSDFPYLNRPFPLISKKLLLALLSAGEFNYRLYPTRIYDISIKEALADSYDESRLPFQVDDASLFTNEFVILQLRQWTNVLDYKNTIVAKVDFAADSEIPMRASDLDDIYIFTHTVERLALTVPEAELPGVFHIEGLGDLLCTSRTKDACRKAGIVGVDFIPIPTPLSSGKRSVEGGFRSISEEELAAFG